MNAGEDCNGAAGAATAAVDGAACRGPDMRSATRLHLWNRDAAAVAFSQDTGRLRRSRLESFTSRLFIKSNQLPIEERPRVC